MRWITITPAAVSGSDMERTVYAGDGNLLTGIYRKEINDYPRFFKMDGLCRLGFIASELLLKHEEGRFCPRADRAVILFNSKGSDNVDRRYQATISDEDNYYPSPSLFVYTLPNIVTGEIAIRNKYNGETAFYITEDFSSETIAGICASALQDHQTNEIISGWVEYSDDQDFKALVFLAEREELEDKSSIVKQLNHIYTTL